MKRKLLSLIFILSLSVAYCQDSVVYFSDAIKENLHIYNNASNRAFYKKDFEEGQRLFDSLVQYKLVGTQFDDFTIKSYRSKSIKLSQIKKPIFIITYVSWCVIGKGEIPALNKLSKEHQDDIQFIVLFWDKKSSIKDIVQEFCSDIKICYANESYDKDYRIIATIKHTLGFPTSFFIDKNKKVVSIKRISNKFKPRTSYKNALAQSYECFSKNINESLLYKTAISSSLVTK